MKETFTVRAENGEEMVVKENYEMISSLANKHYEWKVDFRPFRLALNEDSTNKDGRIYLADNEEMHHYHAMDEAFVQIYDPTIYTNADGEEACNDVKLPSGRWLEQIHICRKDGKVVFEALIDAYGTYNEQR